MAATAVPVNPRVLDWARAASGLSPRQLARAVETDEHVVAAWLSGQHQPTTTEFNALVKVLHRPPSFFFLPRPPLAAPPSASLRVAYGSNGLRDLSADERFNVRVAHRRQRIARWTCENLAEVHPVDFPELVQSPERMAVHVARWLHWRVEDQVKATSKSAVMKLLRRKLEDAGVLVFQLRIGEDECRGFSLYDPIVPLIAVNGSKQLPSARSYTILHELAHLLHGEEAVCGASDSAHERWCDRFAASMLLPAGHLREYVKRNLKLSYVDDDNIDAVRLISNRYKASFQSVALRLSDLGLASRELFRLIRTGLRGQEEDKGFARERNDTPVVRMREYGRNFPLLVLEGYDRGLIADAEVRKYLNVNGEQLSKLTYLLNEDE